MPKSPTFLAVQLFMLITLVIISVMQAFYLLTAGADQRKVLEQLQCQAILAEETRTATNSRILAAASDRASLRLYFQVANDAYKRGDFAMQQKALDDYFESQRQADADRINTPIPVRDCGIHGAIR